MSTATTPFPGQPLRAVWGPEDVDDVRESINTQKRRWGAFLTAKDLLLGRLQATGAALEQLVERWHLSGVVRLAQRSLGWLLGRHGIARRTLRAGGVRPALTWLLTTSFGRSLITPALRTAGSMLRACGRAALHATSWVLRLFGGRGQRAATALQERATAVHVAVSSRLTAAGLVAQVLADPDGLPMQAVRGWAKGRVVSEALRRVLPRRWAFLARAAANLMAIPAALRRQAAHMVTGVTNRPPTDPGDRPTPPAAAAAKPQHSHTSHPTAAEAEALSVDVGAETAQLLDLGQQRSLRTSTARSEADNGSYQRYPAPRRSGTAKRKR